MGNKILEFILVRLSIFKVLIRKWLLVLWCVKLRMDFVRVKDMRKCFGVIFEVFVLWDFGICIVLV